VPTGLDPIVIALGVSDSPSRRERDLAQKRRSRPGAVPAPDAPQQPAPPPDARADPVIPSVPGPTDFIAAVASANLPAPPSPAADALRAQSDRWAPPPSGLSLTDRRV